MVYLNHFYHRIQGWPNQLPSLYAEMVKQFPSGSHFVEVGAWKGASTAAMAVEIINSGKTIKFDVVDTWLGDGTDAHALDKAVMENRLYEEFLRNMEPVKDYITINPVRMTSLEAAALYEDNSLDFVSIDASHDYDNVKADILAWLPKVKSGGILAGDDYPYPGVTKATNELLPDFKHSTAAWWWNKP